MKIRRWKELECSEREDFIIASIGMAFLCFFGGMILIPQFTFTLMFWIFIGFVFASVTFIIVTYIKCVVLVFFKKRD